MKTRIAEIIKNHQTFEIITHENPDEDAVGSSRALGFALAAMGKSVCLVYPTPVSEIFVITESPENMEAASASPEISLLVDVSDTVMLKGVKPRGHIVVVDHHRTRNIRCTDAWIDPEKSSASEMVYALVHELGITVTPAMAANLFMGLFGDTGGFMHANTNPEVFRLAFELTSAGADPHFIAYRLKKSRPFVFFQILCRVMDRMKVQDGVFGSYITFEEFQKIQAEPEDSSGIVEEITSIASSVLVIFMREIKPGTVHCSIRSKIDHAALNTAVAFGGGGHGRAAGFTMAGKPEDMFPKVFKEGLQWVKTE
jgi:bifunctional oligoribonuclease and PAP phosphatase NrnA